MGEIYLANFGTNVDTINHEAGHLITEKRDPHFSMSWYTRFRGGDYSPEKPITQLGMLCSGAKGTRGGYVKVNSTDFNPIYHLQKKPVPILPKRRQKLKIPNLRLKVCGVDQETAIQKGKEFLRTLRDVPKVLRINLGEVNLYDESPRSRIRGWHRRRAPSSIEKEVSEDIAFHIAGFYKLYRIARQQPLIIEEETALNIRRLLEEELMQKRAGFLISQGILPQDFGEVVRDYFEALTPSIDCNIEQLLVEIQQKAY